MVIVLCPLPVPPTKVSPISAYPSWWIVIVLMVDGDGDVPVSVNEIEWPAIEAYGEYRSKSDADHELTGKSLADLLRD